MYIIIMRYCHNIFHCFPYFFPLHISPMGKIKSNTTVYAWFIDWLLLKRPANSITFILRTTARSTMCEHYIQMNDRLASRDNDFCSAYRKVCGELGKAFVVATIGLLISEFFRRCPFSSLPSSNMQTKSLHVWSKYPSLDSRNSTTFTTNILCL
jgi:hypothetical protein